MTLYQYIRVRTCIIWPGSDRSSKNSESHFFGTPFTITNKAIQHPPQKNFKGIKSRTKDTQMFIISQRTNIINITKNVCQNPRNEVGMNKIPIFVSILVIVPPTWLLPDNLTTACQSFRKFWSYQEIYLSFLRNTFKHVLKMQKYQLLDYRTYSDKIKESLISPP